MKKIVLALLAGLLSLPAMAGTLTLTPSVPVVNVGDTFTVEVRYEGNTNEMTDFSLLVLTNASALFVGATVDPFFDDLGRGPLDNPVVGIQFPGNTATDFALAVLSFEAIEAGLGEFTVSGEAGFLDGNFDVVLEQLSVAGTVRVVDGAAIPEPGTVALVLLAIPAGVYLKRRRAA